MIFSFNYFIILFYLYTYLLQSQKNVQHPERRIETVVLLKHFQLFYFIEVTILFDALYF